jgi:hypothetical protein
MAIVSKFYDGPVSETDWAKNRLGAPLYGVNGADDWRVTAVSGADRTISIATGSGFGQGVADTSDTNVTIQLGTIASGTRWDLVAMRRDWQPAAGGPSAFVAVAGTSSKALPADRQNTPGMVDDQPLALVQVTAGETLPSAVVDLRCWSSNGGIEAADALALQYLQTPGAAIKIGGSLWRYERDANGLWTWVGYDQFRDSGWVDMAYAPGFEAGAPGQLKYKFADGMLHILGGAQKKSGSFEAFSYTEVSTTKILPDFRPSKTIYHGAAATAGRTADVQISSTGTIQLVTHHNDAQWISAACSVRIT